MSSRLTIEYLQMLQAQGKIRGFITKHHSAVKKRSKYNNKKQECDGFVFDSKKEVRRWKQLKILLKTGHIGLLERQVPFDLVVRDKKIGRYIADFRYVRKDTGETVVEDVKSVATRKLAPYRLKKKLMKAIHQIEIQEV